MYLFPISILVVLFSIYTVNPVQEFNLEYKNQIEELYNYNKSNGYNTEIAIFADMGKHSGINRFTLYNFTTGKVLLSCLVSHGCCDNPWGLDISKTNPIFKNTPESHCSSVGKFKIGNRGYSNWGININYKLHGLDRTNSNAYSRYIVLHSWDKVSDTEIYPSGTPEGWGCPAISNNNLRALDKYLKNQSKQVILYVFI